MVVSEQGTTEQAATQTASEQQAKQLIELDRIVNDFNTRFTAWEHKYGAGANFAFRYTPEGTKVMHIIDIGTVSPLSADAAAQAQREVPGMIEGAKTFQVQPALNEPSAT
jgi:hypothetical protein